MAARKVFVSYAKSDQALARDVVRALRPMKVDVWSDDLLHPGDDWQEVLRARLRESDYFVLVLTPRTFDSPWAMQELGAAWALNKHIIPVVTDTRLLDTLPVDLGEVQAVQATELDKLDAILEGAA
jgi:nucleoside 2-deoxyribosyltransferase